jgi:hypothetical protein
MNIKTRLEKLEQDNQPSGLVIVALNEGETNEQSYKRCFPDGSTKPKTVIYATPLDVLL